MLRLHQKHWFSYVFWFIFHRWLQKCWFSCCFLVIFRWNVDFPLVFETKLIKSLQKHCVFEGRHFEKCDSTSNFEGQNHQVSILQYKITKNWHRTRATGATGSWPWTAARNLPSSRAGVRMTVVLNKLPQIRHFTLSPTHPFHPFTVFTLLPARTWDAH